MMARITQQALRNSSDEVLQAVEQGQSFVITRSGRPAGELVPIRRRQFVPRALVREAFAGAATIDADWLRADLDRSTDQDSS